MTSNVVDPHELSVADVGEVRKAELLQRAQWLRAAILGANDGLLSTASLMLGVGAAKEDHRTMIISGLAGAVAGAFSMAIGEFVSVSTQRDIELTTMNKCSSEAEVLGRNDVENTENNEPMSVISGSTATPSNKVVSPVVEAVARSPLMRVKRDQRANSVLLDHGVSLPNPYKASGASGVSFLCGSLFPLISALVFPNHKIRVVGIVVVASIVLAGFGGAGAHLGRLSVRASMLRVVVGGWIAMALTYGLLKPLHSD